MTDLIRMGEGGLLDLSRVVAAGRARSAPIRRLLKAAEPGRVINLTYGYPRESVLLLDNGYLAIVSLTVEELLHKLDPLGGEEVTF